MNETEKKAFTWLLSKGFSESDIHYQARRNPDFLIANGDWYEAKRVAGRTIFFGFKQFRELKENAEKTTVLAFTGTSREPVLLPMNDLTPNAVVKSIKISIGNEVVQPKILVNLPTEIVETLDAYAEREFKGNRSMAIYKILKTFFEPKEEEHAVS